ncbi:hypothetical protein NW768_005874 [Fusarium equiseti]|uniref:Uncharacterized protein n=1 Tax=Fusarium equiseti TaxID=61235 RepID=A0ABQ8RD50_FUSEQ|nr:hypothetical protein NW768_005874 [Fusarium equiseti]
MGENEFVLVTRPRKRDEPTPSEKAIAETLQKTEERLQAAETMIQTLAAKLRASEVKQRQDEFNNTKNTDRSILRRLEELEASSFKNNNRVFDIKAKIDGIVPGVKRICNEQMETVTKVKDAYSDLINLARDNCKKVTSNTQAITDLTEQVTYLNTAFGIPARSRVPRSSDQY